jgi:hypothetical protein
MVFKDVTLFVRVGDIFDSIAYRTVARRMRE